MSNRRVTSFDTYHPRCKQISMGMLSIMLLASRRSSLENLASDNGIAPVMSLLFKLIMISLFWTCDKSSKFSGSSLAMALLEKSMKCSAVALAKVGIRPSNGVAPN